jgi:signal transduction histidine kinase
MRLRVRITLAAAVPLGLALLIGTGAVTSVYSHGREQEVTRSTRAEAAALRALVADGQVARVLPLPGGSTLLAQVLGPDGQVIAASATASQTQPLPSRSGVLHSDLATGVPLRVVAEKVGEDTVVVAAPLTDVRRAVRAFQVVLLVVVPLLLIATSAVVWWVTGLALRPVDALRRAAEAPDATTLPVPPGDDELSRLATTLNSLLSRLRDQLERERGFIADAAHELRTPIASLQLQLDVADDPSPGLLAEVTRLRELVESLLALARVEAEAAGPRVELDLTEVTGATGPPAYVIGDRASLTRLVDNLVSNARRHATRVEVTTAVDQYDVVLDVDDDGPGIPAGDRRRVFERWVRLDPARAREAGGVGLGLSLCRAIAESHGGSVTVLDSPLGGARLEVRLPRVRSAS